ncbi:MAG: hypothetical protein V1678_04970 [Candidatus Aenigmatarchaeota archaeon]
MKRTTKNRIASLFIGITFLISGFAYAIISAVPSGTGSTGWAAILVILVDGEQYPIPAETGYVNNETFSKLYTISTDGVLYKGVEGDVMLGEFFKAWNKTFNSTCVLDYCNTNTSSMMMFVNGRQNLDYEYYIVKSQDQIIIDYR